MTGDLPQQAPEEPEAAEVEPEEYDLEHLEIDWSQIAAKEVEKGRWEFAVPNREAGRKTGFEVSKGYPATQRNSVRWLSDPSPLTDLRLSGQVSFREYDEEDDNRGEIKLVTITLQYNVDSPEIYDPFVQALAPVLDKVGNQKSL